MILAKHTVFYRLSLWFGSIKENEFGGAWNIGKIFSGSMADPEMAKGQERGYTGCIMISYKNFLDCFFCSHTRVLVLCSQSGKEESKEIISLYTKSYSSEKMRENTNVSCISV